VAKTAQALMVELGDAINSYLADSPPLREKIAEIKMAGYDVLIAFEANVVLLPDDGTRGAEVLVQ
jgi:hypothetical protein